MAPETRAASAEDPLLAARFRAMGCDVEVIAPDDRRDGVIAARDLMDSWDRRFSRFRPDSELQRVNDAGGRPFRASPEMLRVVQAASDAAHASGGLFDPLLGTRMIELGYDRTFSALPPERPARQPTAWDAAAGREILVDHARGTVQLPAGYALDLGGIAKGMAVDAAVETMAHMDVPYAAVSAGGDLAVHGLPPGHDAWPIAIDGMPEAALLRSGGLATSSVRTRRWRIGNDERHHLLDPRTGLPADGPIAQASVAAESCRQAEVAAKVALLSDVPAALSFLVEHRLAGVLLTTSGTAYRAGPWQ